MDTYKTMLGDKLMRGGEKVNTEEALSSCSAVALYFSAHWCGPCRGFTPELADAYSKHLKEKGLEIVFISSDRDEAAFNEYFAEMPWLSLPYEARALKASLSKRHKVSGIPSLIILDKEGNTITKDGRECISKDPEGEDFPWVPPSLDDLLDTTFIRGDGNEVPFADIKGKTVGLYFSAHWCPPCKSFTPELVKTYQKVKEAGKEFEMIFLSSDRDEAAFKDYFAEMPWLALPYADRQRKADLSSHFGVQGIPTLVMLDVDGTVITDGARSSIEADPEGKEFPWHPKPVNDLHSPDGINDTPSLCVLMEKAPVDVQAEISSGMQGLAEPILAEAKSSGKDQPYCFFTATSGGGVVDRVRSLTKLGEAAESPVVVLLDVADEGSFYVMESPDECGSKLTTESLRDFLKGYEAGSLEKSTFGAAG